MVRREQTKWTHCKKSYWLLRTHAGLKKNPTVGRISFQGNGRGWVAFRKLLRNGRLQAQQGVKDRKHRQDSLTVWVCGPWERKAEFKLHWFHYDSVPRLQSTIVHACSFQKAMVMVLRSAVAALRSEMFGQGTMVSLLPLFLQSTHPFVHSTDGTIQLSEYVCHRGLILPGRKTYEEITWLRNKQLWREKKKKRINSRKQTLTNDASSARLLKTVLFVKL